MANQKEIETVCKTCNEPYVKLDRNGDAHYCRCWTNQLNEALEAAGDAPSKQSVDFVLTPKMRNTGTGKLYSGQEAETVFLASKASAFPTWDAKGRSESDKQELKRKQPKQLRILFKEHPDQPESATLIPATPTTKLEEKLLNAGLTPDEIELALRRYWDKAELKVIKEEFEFSSIGTTDRRCKAVLRKIKKSGILSRDDEV